MAYGVYSDRGYREHILERNKNTNKTEVFTQEDQTFTGRKTFLSGVTTSDLEVQTVEVSENLKVKGKDIWEILAGENVRSVNGKEPDNATGNITLYGTDILISETERINVIEKIKHYVGTTLLGRHWTQSNKTDGAFYGGARYANGIWVACGSDNNGLWYSTDGMNWTQSNKTDGSFAGGARYANGIWVACSNGLWYSDVQTLIDNGWLK